MALNTSNRLIVKEQMGITLGMSDTNHIQMFLQESPELFNKVMVKTFSARNIQSNPLMELTEGRGKVRFLQGNTDTWQWDQEIAETPARVVEDVATTNPGIDTSQLGRDGLPFRIKMDKDWFAEGMVISTDKVSQLRIGQEPVYRETQGWVYTVYLVTDTPQTASYQYSYCQPGVEYVFLYSVYGENATQAAKSHFQGSIKLMNNLPDMIRHEASITGYADDRTLTIANVTVDDKTGDVVTVNDAKWMKRVEMKFWKDFYKQIDDSLFYSVGSNHLKGESGYNVRTGYGLKQQLSWGNVEAYSVFSEKLLREYFLDIFFGRVDAKHRNVVMLTGEYGMVLFDEAFKRATSGFFMNSEKFTTGSGMDMGYGFQFTKYYMINGGTITLKYLPSLDTRVTNTMRSTVSGYPVDSATFYILDLSGENADNIWMVKHKDSQKYGYIVGTSAPWPMKGGVMSNAKDGYTILARDRVGLHIEDLSKTGKLYLSQNA